MRALATVVVVELVLGTLPAPSGGAPLGDAATTTLRREPLQRPGELGNGALNGLQYADPTAGIDMVRPPESNNQGNAVMELPISIPPGRGGVQPDLTLTYDSGGGNGWLGMGWDLNLGEITVDTRWGVPRYDDFLETETYLLDSALLSPTAITSDLQPRVTNRADFTRRVEDSYDLIIRHGDNPTNYWWEVRTKMGGIKWYGGKPDKGGPTGADGYTDGLGGSLDPDAVLTDGSGHIYRWALAAERDVGVNMMFYEYETVAGERIGLDGETNDYGKQMYLKEVRYTATAEVGGRDQDPRHEAPYRATFLRDSHVGIPADQRRKDVIIDARGGFVQVTSDLLRRIDVHYGDPVFCPEGVSECDLERNYNQLSRRYNLNYAEGAFAKALLKSVDQLDSNGAVFATNSFSYYDEVRASDGGYNGFAPVDDWETVDDNLFQVLLGPVEVSALGASATTSADVHAFLGFNLIDPTKLPSVGAAVTVAGGATEALAEFFDINGDLLPDKVFRDGLGGPVMYRLNQSGPNGQTTFGEKREVGGLSRLSTEWNIGASISAEAHLGVSVQFDVGFDVSVGEDYFTDVNQDGLVDLVSAGRVHFNRLEEQPDGSVIPVFRSDSTDTLVPVSSTAPDLSGIKALEDLQKQQEKDSPLADTVRRWIAPWAGVISIGGAVTLDPPPETRFDSPPYDSDGVRVAIQKHTTELWSASLATPGQSVTPTGVTQVQVARGEAVFFRVQSIYDGNRDQVKWEPVIQYAGQTPSLDVNGLDVYRYEAAKEFTLAGRTSYAQMPLTGRLRVQGVVHKSKGTSDDVGVVVTKNNQLVPGAPHVIPAAFVGDVPVSFEVDVLGPRNNGTREGDYDRIALALASDSPIDVSAVTWTNMAGNRGPEMFYVTATKDGQPIQTVVNGDHVLRFQPIYAQDIYAATNRDEPQESWKVPDDGDDNHAEARQVFVDFDVRTPDLAPEALRAAPFVFTVKSRDGSLLLCKERDTAAFPFYVAGGECTIDVKENDELWFDITTRSHGLMRFPGVVADVDVAWVTEDGPRADSPPVALHWPVQPFQGDPFVDVFAEPFRGWGFAGYNGDGARASQPLNPFDFFIPVEDEDDFPDPEENPEDRPDDFEDEDFDDPVRDGKSYPYVPWYLDLRDAANKVVGTVPSWRGFKDNLVGTAGFVRSSRVSTDNPAVVRPSDTNPPPAGSGRVSGVRRVGLTAPTLGVVASALFVGVAFAMAPSFGLLDYTDLNGDGFPDIVAPNEVTYTDARGAYFDDESVDLAVPSSDMTFAVGVGFSGAAADVKGNAKGDSGTAQDTKSTSGAAKGSKSSGAAGQGDDSTKTRYGYSIGGGVDISASFSNPAAPGELGEIIDSDVGIENELADVNGDGLPDRIVSGNGTVDVYLNLGYDFDSEKITWARDGFETGVSLSGSIAGDVGFQIFNRGISGGISYNEDIDFPIYSWVDVNGDGILDRLTKDGGDVVVAFGTGAGVLPNTSYGSFKSGSYDIGGHDLIPTGEQIAFDHSRGLGAGFDVTIPIGPLCLIGCWIIINPGAHFSRSISSSQVQLADINGDGYADSLKSLEDGEVEVNLNNHGRTNLLSTAKNPLGGEVRLGYKRDGNTVAQPFSQWVLDRVEVDDGRPGDGVDVELTTFEYSGNRYSPLEREILGYAKVVDRQRAHQGDANPYDDPVLRSIEREFLNGTVFESGLLKREALLTPDEKRLKETTNDWQFLSLDNPKGRIDLSFDPSDAAGLRFLPLTVAPQQTKVTHRWFDAAGDVGQETWSTFEYDDLGNVARLLDVGEPELASDDVVAITTYSSCPDSASADLKLAFPCPAPKPAGRISPLWSPLRCPTWTAIPATLQVNDGTGNVLRDRNGAPALCDNSSMTHEEERLADGTVAVTDLDYDEWGSYNHIVYPANADGERLRVDYVYDEGTHANVSITVESRPANRPHDDPEDVTDPANGIPYLTATRLYDGRTGRIASREDANGQKTTYTYDPVGRLETVRGPYQVTGSTVVFDYFPTAPGYAYATARHFDAFAPASGDTIDTVTFADGTGRVTQTKQDATVFRTPNGPPADVMVVSGAVDYDALGRVVKEWYPIEEPLGSAGTFNQRDSGNGPPGPPTTPTITTFDLLDRVVDVRLPNDLHIGTAYGFADDGLGATLFTATVTDQLGKRQRSHTDVRDLVRAVDDLPDGKPRIRARYDYDELAQLTEVVDNGGNKTTHTYDQFGRRVSTATPNGGLVEWRWDLASNLVTEIDANMRANGVQTNYSYDADRLVAIDYPPGTPDVSYAWGVRGAPGNGAGRVVSVVDGARDQRFTYDPLGAVATDTSTMLVHNLNDSTGSKQTYTTSFTYEAFGRLRTVTYPDGEVVSNGYDRGGLLKSVAGEKAGIRYVYVDRQEYDHFLDRRLQKVGNGVQTAYDYDPPTRRLVRQVTNTPAREIQDFNFGYDDVGNLTSILNTVPDPKSSLMGGPSSQAFTYDPYYRLEKAEGTYALAPKGKREYSQSLTYDVHGNVASKRQADVIDGKLTQKPTTYDFTSLAYRSDKPHQLDTVGTKSFSYDPNGNLTGWQDGSQNRTVTWDATDRVRRVADQGSTTDYTYDAAGLLAIERGPSGETAFVNDWYSVRNASLPFKHIWAGEDRVATKRTGTPDVEQLQYYLHKDFQGSTNMVTDERALVFQHIEYFPSGERWVVEQSTGFRTPYQHAAGYFDEVRQLLDLGARWYEPREQFLYSPDPVLVADPMGAVDDPALLPAYTYAESNPLTLVDDDGRAPSYARALFNTVFASKRQQQANVRTARNVAVAAVTVPGTSRFGGLPIEAPLGDAKEKGSRLRPLFGFLNDPEAGKKIDAFADKVESKALVEVELIKTPNGYKLDQVRVAPTLSALGQFNVFKRADPAASAGPATKAAPKIKTTKKAKSNPPGP
ncbi:MAG: SpvB/TcaC N-terminal domain-containing protein [Acidimicrobiales bacterium]